MMRRRHWPVVRPVRERHLVGAILHDVIIGLAADSIIHREIHRAPKLVKLETKIYIPHYVRESLRRLAQERISIISSLSPTHLSLGPIKHDAATSAHSTARHANTLGLRGG